MRSEKAFMRLLVACEIVILILVLVFGLIKQLGKDDEPADYIANSQSIETEKEEYIPTETVTEIVTEQETEDTSVFSEEVTALLNSMTLEQKVAQLFMVAPETLTHTNRVTIAGQGTRAALSEYPVGGILYSRRNYQGHNQMRNLVNGAQEISYELSGQYLFVATLVETEAGAVIAVSGDNSAEPLIELITSNGELNELEEGSVQFLTLSTQEETDLEHLGYVPVRNGEEAIAALQNGMGMLCVEESFEDIYKKTLEAANTGSIELERIEQAVGKILTKKLAIIAE